MGQKYGAYMQIGAEIGIGLVPGAVNGTVQSDAVVEGTQFPPIIKKINAYVRGFGGWYTGVAVSQGFVAGSICISCKASGPEAREGWTNI